MGETIIITKPKTSINATDKGSKYQWKGPIRRWECLICGQSEFQTQAAVKTHVTRMHLRPKERREEIRTVVENIKARKDMEARVQESKETFHDEMRKLRADTPKQDWTDSMWLAELDSIILQSGIVPTATAEKPNGMDRAECLEHLVNLAKAPSVQPPPPADNFANCAPPPWWVKLVDDFQGACIAHAMMLEKEDAPANSSALPKEVWNGVINDTFEKKRKRFLLILELLVKRSEVADRLERELLDS